MAEESYNLLRQLENIMEFDPLIDEVGFVHPSQFATLNDETVPQTVDARSKTSLLDGNASQYDTHNFWYRDHKLAISTEILFPLYHAARHAFMTALKQHQILVKLRRKSNLYVDEMVIDGISVSEDFLQSELLKHSHALLLLSCDFGTAWNSRKLVLSQKQKLSLFMNELLLSALVLSYSPKSEHSWSHRRWVIKTMDGKDQDLQEIVERESELVENIAERSKMNYRAWNHRCWLVGYMTREQVLNELNKSRKWAEMHAADNCCFHYRRRLLHRILENNWTKQASNAYTYWMPHVYLVWKVELDWDEKLIKRYVGREALWVHRRFLSQLGIDYFANGSQGTPCKSEDLARVDDDHKIFIRDELLLLRSCLDVSDNDFEDSGAQAVLAASYILWLLKQMPKSQATEIQEKLRDLDLMSFLNNLCPGKALLWRDLSS